MTKAKNEVPNKADKKVAERKLLSRRQLESKVAKILFEGTADSDGVNVFNVTIKCTQASGGEVVNQFSVRADTPEQAKQKAADMAVEMGYVDYDISGVDLVPNIDTMTNTGQGSLNANGNAVDGQVMPDEVSPNSDLPNDDSKLSLAPAGSNDSEVGADDYTEATMFTNITDLIPGMQLYCLDDGYVYNVDQVFDSSANLVRQSDGDVKVIYPEDLMRFQLSVIDPSPKTLDALSFDPMSSISGFQGDAFRPF